MRLTTCLRIINVSHLVLLRLQTTLIVTLSLLSLSLSLRERRAERERERESTAVEVALKTCSAVMSVGVLDIVLPAASCCAWNLFRFMSVGLLLRSCVLCSFVCFVHACFMSKSVSVSNYMRMKKIVDAYAVLDVELCKYLKM